MHYIHLSGFVHQDIHLGNVFTSLLKDELVQSNSTALTFKLGDLGITKLFGEIDAQNTILAEWMLPPEYFNQGEFGPLDHRMDIYHCALLLLAVILGKEITFTKEEILAGVPKQQALQLAAPYNFALEKALRRHVAYRTASAMELWRDLNSTANTAAIPALPEAQT